MRRILSERNLVVILFIMALVFFTFANRETKKVELQYLDQENALSSMLPAPPPPPQPVPVRKEDERSLADIQSLK